MVGTVDRKDPHGQVVQLAGSYIHECYNRTTARNDIAIIKLATALTLTKFPSKRKGRLMPICLPPMYMNLHKTSKCFTVGWGRTFMSIKPNILQEIPVRVMDSATCNRRHKIVNQYQFCTISSERRSTSNSGDSGSPLVCLAYANHWYIAGITSFSYHSRSGYTKVSNYLGPNPPVRMERGLTDIPTTMLLKHIQPMLYTRIARNYHSIVNPNRPFIIRTADIPKDGLCSSTLIEKIFKERGGVYRGGRMTKLEEGGQAQVYKIDANGEQIVLKFFDEASSLIIEANALIGLQLHRPQIGDYVLKDMMSGYFPRRQRIAFNHIKEFTYIEKQGDFCATFPFIRGQELHNHPEALDAFKHNLKRILRFIVQLLRQIQAIHFTLNRYALTEPGQQDFLGVNTYANA
ncbi:hypothetical protein SNEBB_010741, partial [Seison nebaliae]